MYRNSQKRIYDANSTFSITSVTLNRIHHFRNKVLCELWIKDLKICKDLKKFDLYAFCLLYDHFHILLKPNDNIATISEIMRSFKTNFSRNAHLINKGDVTSRRLYFVDNNLLGHYNYLEKIQQVNLNSLNFKWQKSFHHHYIRNLKDYTYHYNYIISNHYNHSLPETWKYVSTNYPDMIDFYE